MVSTSKLDRGELAALIGSRREPLGADLTDDWATCLALSVQEVEPLVDATLAQLTEALETGVSGRLIEPFSEWAAGHAEEADGLAAKALLDLTQALSERTWEVMVRAGAGAEDLRQVMDLIARARTAAVVAWEARQARLLSQERRRAARLAEAQTRLAQQVRDLSSPVIKVWEEVLVLPLVGTLDADRAARVTSDLLQGIVEQQAEIVIIDVTGVPMVDTHVVNHLMRTVKAAGLLGAQSVVVGIKSRVAQTMIQLGIDLQGIETRRDLQAGIVYALQTLGLRIVPQDHRDGAAEDSLGEPAVTLED